MKRKKKFPETMWVEFKEATEGGAMFFAFSDPKRISDPEKTVRVAQYKLVAEYDVETTVVVKGRT